MYERGRKAAVKISVVVPVYNTSTWLRPCVESVLAQQDSVYELILVDDGSTDGSGALCDDLARQYPQIRVLHKQNGGLSSARNAGLALASGEYIFFLDSDDLLAHSGVLHILADAVAETDADVLCFDYYHFPDKSGPTLIAPRKGSIGYAPAGGIDINLERLVRNNAYQSSACFKMIKRTLLHENNLLFEEGRYCEDVLYSGRLLVPAQRVAYLGKVLYGYRFRAGSISARVGPKHVDDLVHAVEQLVILAEHCLPGRRKAILGYASFQYCTLLINWRLAGSPQEGNQLKRLKAMDFLLKCSQYSAVQLIRFCNAILGLRATSRLLQWYHHMKTRHNLSERKKACIIQKI